MDEVLVCKAEMLENISDANPNKEAVIYYEQNLKLLALIWIMPQ